LPTDADIAAIPRTTPDPQQACQRLVQAANHAGGEGNITVVLVDQLGIGHFSY